MEAEPKLVPEQETGQKSETSFTVNTSTREEAINLFRTARKRLMDVNQWHLICKGVTAVFHLTDEKGADINRLPQLGDHFRIEIPTPDKVVDWVQIEALEDRSDKYGDQEIISIRVRPSGDPTKNRDEISHFFDDTASSTFTVLRENNSVRASVHGRNEIPNLSTPGLIGRIRNVIVGIGAMFGLNKPQWKKLVEGLLKP